VEVEVEVEVEGGGALGERGYYYSFCDRSTVQEFSSNYLLGGVVDVGFCLRPANAYDVYLQMSINCRCSCQEQPYRSE
jgi:hypothetical protein